MNTKQNKKDTRQSLYAYILLAVMSFMITPAMSATIIRYVYDDLNRLTEVTRDDGPTLNHSYDEVGNITLASSNNPDTDGDGLKDVAEINIYKTDPANPDTDGDGLTDGDEVNIYKTDPTNPDTDGDGLPDGVDPYPLISSDPESDSDIPFLPPFGLAVMTLLLVAIGGRKTLAAKRTV